jgi:hypothetical protein
VAKTKTTIYLDGEVLRAARVFAARTGKRDSQIVEEALKRYLGLDVLGAVWARSTLDEDEAATLAHEAVHETRKSS